MCDQLDGSVDIQELHALGPDSESNIFVRGTTDLP